MDSSQNKGLVPYDLVSPGFEAVYTGETSSSPVDKTEIITTLTQDKAGNIIRKWAVFPWTFPGQEKDWDEKIEHINSMQIELGPLDNDTRQIRAHIASLVPCDSGFPVTVDELLNAIGRGKLEEPSFRNGCWCPGMWWELKTSQPFHMESMDIIQTVLRGYLKGKPGAHFIRDFPHAEGFIKHVYDWLGPASKLSEVQLLMMERMLLTIDYFAETSDTIPCDSWLDEAQQRMGARIVKNLFEAGGQGAGLDAKISEKAGLPKIHPRWDPEFRENLQSLEDPRKKDFYETCSSIASGVHTLSDCHHSTFRYIESWIHGIGTGRIAIPSRHAGKERKRLGHLLFGYVLGLDKWLSGALMPFLQLEMEHLDLGFNPKNEILRVYAYLGEERTPVKEWLAACLWHNLTCNPVAGNPGSLVRHKDLLDLASRSGIRLCQWLGSKAVILND
ncbi:MAG: hypothetical protein JXB23_06900 [Candidatus Aminicenantes bacterium]|nr:hypothetical protein [Candidatus Aminicenantes bacterium]